MRASDHRFLTKTVLSVTAGAVILISTATIMKLQNNAPTTAVPYLTQEIQEKQFWVSQFRSLTNAIVLVTFIVGIITLLFTSQLDSLKDRQLASLWKSLGEEQLKMASLEDSTAKTQLQLQQARLKYLELEKEITPREIDPEAFALQIRKYRKMHVVIVVALDIEARRFGNLMSQSFNAAGWDVQQSGVYPMADIEGVLVQANISIAAEEGRSIEAADFLSNELRRMNIQTSRSPSPDLLAPNTIKIVVGVKPFHTFRPG